ncbi:zinc finger protein 157-like [Cydia splendana]|uniref:zinc finger protein 157-like n=1 Tax=Cydia splendana TaxID=1100963 RepID=UPI002146AE27
MIRTYKRKPLECRYIEGVMGLCRLCLGTAESAVPIFTEDPDNICSTLAMRIMICVGLDVKRDDNLPNLVCVTCYKDLEHYYAFRKKCELSYHRLKSHLQASRNRQPIETVTENEEILKEMCNQDENMNINEFGLEIGEESDSKVEPESVISDVQTVDPVQQNTEVPQEEYRIMQPGELNTLITSVLVKLGILSQRDDQLSVLRGDVSRLQLEAGDGAVVRMELVEEADELEADTQDYLIEISEAPAPAEVPKATKTGFQRQAKLIEPKPSFVEAKKNTSKIHTNIGAMGCSVCGRVLASRSALLRHERTHSGERPFACPRCDRCFAQKEVMHRHMLVHEAVRPHKCSTCNKSFTQRNALHLHERSHLPPHERALALHSCPHCPKLFLYSSGLSRHMMTHSGRVYVCGACRRQFADKSSVLRHHRARHAHLEEPDEPECVETENAPTEDENT